VKLFFLLNIFESTDALFNISVVCTRQSVEWAVSISHSGRDYFEIRRNARYSTGHCCSIPSLFLRSYVRTKYKSLSVVEAVL
jgi:hypothetical protein